MSQRVPVKQIFPFPPYSRAEPGEPESCRHIGDICFCQTVLGLIHVEHRCHQKQMSQQSWMNRFGLQQSADFHPSLTCRNWGQHRYTVCLTSFHHAFSSESLILPFGHLLYMLDLFLLSKSYQPFSKSFFCMTFLRSE